MYYICFKRDLVIRYWGYVWLCSCGVLLAGGTTYWIAGLTISLVLAIVLIVIVIKINYFSSVLTAAMTLLILLVFP